MREARVFGENIKARPLDDLFSTQAERDEARLEKVLVVPLSEVYDFPDHPFAVRDDEEMEKMVESIKESGVMTPAIVRRREGGGYELISGHRRKHGSELAGLTEIPVIVREMDDDSAIIQMVDSNMQRENILPTEKARAYQMKLEAIKRKAGRTSKNNCGQVGHNLTGTKSRDIVADNCEDSSRTVQRYIRLNSLIPELQEMVDDKKLKLNPAVEISYLTPQEQHEFYDFIGCEERTPSLSQAQKLKAASREKKLNEDSLLEIMTSQPPSVKPREPQVSLSLTQVAKYFPSGFTAEQIAERILKMLEAHYRSRQQQRRQAER